MHVYRKDFNEFLKKMKQDEASCLQAIRQLKKVNTPCAGSESSAPVSLDLIQIFKEGTCSNEKQLAKELILQILLDDYVYHGDLNDFSSEALDDVFVTYIAQDLYSGEGFSSEEKQYVKSVGGPLEKNVFPLAAELGKRVRLDHYSFENWVQFLKNSYPFVSILALFALLRFSGGDRNIPLLKKVYRDHINERDIAFANCSRNSGQEFDTHRPQFEFFCEKIFREKSEEIFPLCKFIKEWDAYVFQSYTQKLLNDPYDEYIEYQYKVFDGHPFPSDLNIESYEKYLNVIDDIEKKDLHKKAAFVAIHISHKVDIYLYPNDILFEWLKSDYFFVQCFARELLLKKQKKDFTFEGLYDLYYNHNNITYKVLKRGVPNYKQIDICVDIYDHIYNHVLMELLLKHFSRSLSQEILEEFFLTDHKKVSYTSQNILRFFRRDYRLNFYLASNNMEHLKWKNRGGILLK